MGRWAVGQDVGLRLYFSLVGKCFVRFQVAFGLVGLPVLPKVFQQFAHFGGVFGAAGGFCGEVVIFALG